MKYKKKPPIYIGTLNNFNKNAAGEYEMLTIEIYYLITFFFVFNLTHVLLLLLLQIHNILIYLPLSIIIITFQSKWSIIFMKIK